MLGIKEVAFDRYANYDQASCQYSPAYGIIDQQQGYGWFVFHFNTDVVLENVEFNVKEGLRAGCVPTGKLGTATGNLLVDAEILTHPLLEEVPLKFNGQNFVRTDTGKGVQTATRIRLQKDGKAFAQFIPDSTPQAIAPQQASVKISGSVIKV